MQSLYWGHTHFDYLFKLKNIFPIFLFCFQWTLHAWFLESWKEAPHKTAVTAIWTQAPWTARQMRYPLAHRAAYFKANAERKKIITIIPPSAKIVCCIFLALQRRTTSRSHIWRQPAGINEQRAKTTGNIFSPPYARNSLHVRRKKINKTRNGHQRRPESIMPTCGMSRAISRRGELGTQKFWRGGSE